MFGIIGLVLSRSVTALAKTKNIVVTPEYEKKLANMITDAMGSNVQYSVVTPVAARDFRKIMDKIVAQSNDSKTWSALSQSAFAIEYMKTNLDKVIWCEAFKNPLALDLLLENKSMYNINDLCNDEYTKKMIMAIQSDDEQIKKFHSLMVKRNDQKKIESHASYAAGIELLNKYFNEEDKDKFINDHLYAHDHDVQIQFVDLLLPNGFDEPMIHHIM